MPGSDPTLLDRVPRTAAATLESMPVSQDSEILQPLPDVCEAQQRDADIGPIITWIESGPRPEWSVVAPYSAALKCYWAQWDSLRVKEGVLYRLWESPRGDQTVWQLIVPRSLQQDVFQQLHCSPTAGHFGVTKTLRRVRERFYWARNHQDVSDWCRSCTACASRKGPMRRPRAPMAQYNVGVPIERVALDILGPLPVSEAGNKYLLIVADYFTKWPEGYPLPNQEATTVAEALVREFVCRFGVPREIHSDQGRNFESLVFTEMCRLLGMKKTRTTALHPQSDGMVERYNRTIAAQLSIFVDQHQRDWDQHVPLLLMAYRSAVHESTRCTPARLMFGRDLRLPVDLLYGRPEERENTTHYVEALQEKLDKVHDFARERIKLSSDRMKRYYDVRATGDQLNEGDLVWLYNPQRKKGITPKFQRPWQGPFRILKRINDLVYRIQLKPTTKPRVVHYNRLWKYHGDDPSNRSPGARTVPKASETVDEPEEATDRTAEASPDETSSETEEAVDHTGTVLGDNTPTGLRRGSRARRRTQFYGHPRRLTLEEGAV